METYNDLFVRLKPGTTAEDVLQRLNDLAKDDLTWDLEQDLGGAAGFHAMGGSMGWEITDEAAERLMLDGHLEVWTYSTHDEDPEAVFSRYTPEGNTVFIVSTAYIEWEGEGDGEREAEPAEETEGTALSEDQWRQKLGENGYCWSRYERWIDGMPVFHRRSTHEGLVSDVVGERRTKTSQTAG